MGRNTFHTKRLLMFFALISAFATPGAYAATLTANPAATDEATDSDALCSLREAVLSLNAGSDQQGCTADVTDAYGTNDTINLPAGTYILSNAGLDETANGTNENATVVNNPDATIGDLDVMQSVQIIGDGSDTTSIGWDPAEVVIDRIFHIYTTNAATANVDVVIDGVTLTNGKTSEVDLGANTGDATLHYYLRRAGGALALGAAANVVEIDTTLSGSENANSGGLGGSTGGESGATSYSLALNDVVVEDSSAEGDGGGLYIAAPTMATNIVVRNNTSITNGGAIYNEADTSVQDSTFSGNSAEGGGGMFLTGSNTVNIAGTTFTANRAIGGGAISGRSGVTVNVLNSTISGNLGEDVGAGFYANGPSSLAFVTIANNIAGADAPAAGAGVNTFPSGSVEVTLENVLLANNKKGWDPLTDPNGPPDPSILPSANCGYTGGCTSAAIVSAGHNLSSDTSCTAQLNDTSDINNVDPMIGALADNGGPTRTHALLTGSPALGKGAAITGVTVDQRGTTRDTPPDIGAFELPTTTGGGSSSGCTLNPNASFDPVLLVLLGIALGGVYLRRRRKDISRH
jgi:predicted outer membrane repeat protein